MEVLKLNMDWSSQKTINSTLSGIYFIKNIVNNQVYIGSSSNIYQRYLCHRGRLLNNKHHNKHLQYSINKYGIDKLRILNTGRTLTDSAKLKCSKASKKYWDDRGKSTTYLQILEMLKNNKTPKEIKSLLQISSSYISKVKKENKL